MLLHFGAIPLISENWSYKTNQVIYQSIFNARLRWKGLYTQTFYYK